ncbi:sugar-phosphatase [Streptomyces sp. B3I7]|nr:sugar-phosphatase [Streptomyces sp. B3I7]
MTAVATIAHPIRCAAVVFDLDGVLVDSLRLIERILRSWAGHRAVDPDEAVARAHGMRDIDLVRLVAPGLDAAAEARWIAEREERDFAGLRPVPGAPELLTALPSTAWAVATSGTRLVASGRLRAAGLPQPAHLVAAEDITRGKPDPECYRLAVDLLGVPPAHCLAVEDAPNGVRAAVAAGLRCVGVGPAVGEVAHLLHGRVRDLREVDVLGVGDDGIVLALATGPGPAR